MKRCSKCHAYLSLDNFSRDRAKKDGRRSQCKQCCKAYESSAKGKAARKRYEQSELGRAAQKRYRESDKSKATRTRYFETDEAKELLRKWNLGKTRRWRKNNPIKYKAAIALTNAVGSGAIPRVSTQACADCGIVAQEYHHESYDEDQWLVVVPLCRQCHRARHT